jgi:hypothetical protein
MRRVGTPWRCSACPFRCPFRWWTTDDPVAADEELPARGTRCKKRADRATDRQLALVTRARESDRRLPGRRSDHRTSDRETAPGAPAALMLTQPTARTATTRWATAPQVTRERQRSRYKPPLSLVWLLGWCAFSGLLLWTSFDRPPASVARNEAQAAEATAIAPVHVAATHGRMVLRDALVTKNGLVTKNIEDVVTGELVLARDNASGRLEAKRVAQTYRRVADHLRIITVRGADSSVQELRTTDEHPFYVDKIGRSKPATSRSGSGWSSPTLASHSSSPRAVSLTPTESRFTTSRSKTCMTISSPKPRVARPFSFITRTTRPN